jgi:hypothetical protein
MKVTLFWRNALARCCAPSSPIPWCPKSSVASVYIGKCTCGCERNEERITITVLYCNASAKYCAPPSPNLLAPRSKVVSACWIKNRNVPMNKTK